MRFESEPVARKNSCLDTRMDGQIVGRTKLQQFECLCHGMGLGVLLSCRAGA